jgi:Uma2 family endonuclease
MSTLAVPPSRPPVVYPDSDGKPMAENTLQYQWIVTITGGLEHLFAQDPNVFVAGDLFWYPVEGHPEIRLAPDTLVVFGRPKGHRGSYRQWEEEGVAPQIVFEILSPSNRFGEMSAKFDFYQRYGVEEYYIYNPDPARLELSGFLRRGGDLAEIETMHGHVSPRLKVRFEMGEDGLRIIRPDGQPFVTYQELARREQQERHRADEERRHAEQERERADAERRRAEQERERADAERRRAEQERVRADQALRELEQLRQQVRPPGPSDA